MSNSDTTTDMHQLFIEGRLWRKGNSPQSEGLREEDLTWPDLMKYLLYVSEPGREWHDSRIALFICQLAHDGGLGVEVDESGYITQAFVDAREYLRLTRMTKQEAINILVAREAKNRAAHTPKDN